METTHIKAPLLPGETARKDISTPELQESCITKERKSEKQVSAAKGLHGGNVPHDVFTIEVRGFNMATCDETIESFFENKRRSGGGDINTIEIDKTNEVIHVTYYDPTVAENVLKMPALKLEGAMLEVSPVSEWDRRTIEVHGLSPSTSNDTIELFFESKRRSGGGMVEHMQLDTDNNIAYVTFKCSKVAENVLKTNLLLEGAPLTVRPKLSISSRHQPTQREMGSEKVHESKSHDHDPYEHIIPQGRIECEEELRKTGQVWDFNPHQSAGAHVKSTDRVEYCSREGEMQTSGFASTRFSEVAESSHETPIKHERTLREPQNILVEPPKQAATPTVHLATPHDIPVELPRQEVPPNTAPLVAPHDISVEPPRYAVPPKTAPLATPHHIPVEPSRQAVPPTTAYLVAPHDIPVEPPRQAEPQTTATLVAPHDIPVEPHRHAIPPTTATLVTPHDIPVEPSRQVAPLTTAPLVTPHDIPVESPRQAAPPTTAPLVTPHDIPIEPPRQAEPPTTATLVAPHDIPVEPSRQAAPLTTAFLATQHDTPVELPTRAVLSSTTPLVAPHGFPVEPPIQAIPATTAPLIAPRNVIVVKGINETTTEELLTVFFANKKRSGGGPVKKLDYQHTECQATITFHSEEDAQRVLQRGALSLEGAELIITQMEVDEATHERECRPATSCTTIDMSLAHILEIRGFKPGTTQDTVEMFIENKSGESELHSCDYDTKTGIAIVEFKNDQGTTKLMSLRNLEFGGAELSVTQLTDVYAGLDRESCQPTAIHVRGIGSDTSEELLQLFFENRRISGGGDIEHVDYDDDEGFAVIIFKDADSASRVVQKESLTISGTCVQVKLMTPPMSLPVLQGPFEENLVFVSGLSPNCTGDDLKTFFSAQTIHSEIQSVTFSLKPGVAILQFTHPPEFDRLRELCVTKPLRGTMMSLQRVPQARTIQVHNIGEVTEEILKLYFENKRSGGGEVTNAQFFRKDGYALLQFAECAYVRGILAKESHKVENQYLRVTTFYECLGLTPPYHDTTIPGGWIPKNVDVTGFCPRVLDFLQASAMSRELVDTKMAEVAAVVEWGTYNDGSNSIGLTCTISHNMKNAQSMAKTWSHTAENTFLDVLAKNFAFEQIETLQEAWPIFIQRVSYVDELDPYKICVRVDKDTCLVCITGQIIEVENLSAQLKEDHSKVQEEMIRAATTVTETKSGIKLQQLRMLNAVKFRSQQKRKFTDLDVVIDIPSLEVKFSGMPADITCAKLEMYETFDNMTEQFIEMPASLISMLHGQDMMKHMDGQFNKQNICAVYNCAGKNKLGVYAFSDEHVNTAIKVINATAGEMPIEVDVKKMSSPEKWTKLINAHRSQHGGLLTITESENSVVLAGVKSQMEVALEDIRNFLEHNIINEQIVQMEHGAAGYIHMYMKEDVDAIVKTLHRSAVKINAKLDGPPYGYVVAGNSNGLQCAVRNLQKLADDVKVEQFQVDKPGMPKFLTSESGQHSIERLEHRCNVVIELVGKYAQKGELSFSDNGDSAAGGSNTASRVTLPGGATIEVVRGDLTKCHEDAVVNAANGRLEHIGGLAEAIADAGGAEIQRECRDYVRRYGEIADGNVHVSTSGRLPCKKVIHAVGPRWQGGLSNEDSNLRKAVFESMLAAEQSGLSSIALPALSSGIFGFPIDRCTMIIVSTIKDFLEARTQSCVKQVSLVDPKEDALKAFRKSLGAAFGFQNVTTSGGEQRSSQRKDSSGLSTRATTRSQPPALPFYRPSSRTSSSEHVQSTIHPKRTPTSRKTQRRTAEGITLTLCKSEIANEQVDAVVNSTNPSLKLDRGAVSRTLLLNGGKIIELECRLKAPNGIQHGEVVVTSGGRLNCQFIVHGACCPWDGGAGTSEMILRQLLANCFQAAHDQELTSMAIPAIGTGVLGFPCQLVAIVMLDELSKFSRHNRHTTLRDVRFVVYQKDHQTIQVFEEVMFGSEGFQKRDSNLARALARPTEGAAGGIISRSVTEERDEMFRIGSIDVDIAYGDLTKERTDAIVNSSDSNLILQGATSKAIVKAGGPTIVEECKRLGKTGSNGIAVTNAGKLPCFYIIHLNAHQEKVSDWTNVIQNVLIAADSLQIESVAFPALGTGVITNNPSTMADTMLDAIERFTQQKPASSVKLVKIVIFQQSMVQSFRKCASKKASGKKGWFSSVIGRVKEYFHSDGRTDEVSHSIRQHITFNIFGKSPDDITTAKKDMQRLCDDEFKEIVLNGEKDQASIAKLTRTEVNQMRALEDDLDVKITIQNTTSDVSINIQGRPVETSQAQAGIVNIFRQMEDDDKAETLASMYAKQVHWKFASGDGFTTYPEKLNGLLENAFQSKKGHFEWKEDTGEMYRVTFNTMKETTDQYRTGVAVEREEIGVLGRIELPSNWSPMDGDDHVKLERLRSTSQEYKNVETMFLSTAPATVLGVKKIERVQNPSLYRQYVLRKDELEKRSKQPTAIERSLWHGTSVDATRSINQGGFNRSYCGRNAAAFGKGVYFATDSSYSASNTYATPDANGWKHVYQARVLTGEYTQGNSGVLVPPGNPATPGFPFDTVVDSVSTPGIFVVFLDNQAYPEYLITF